MGELQEWSEGLLSISTARNQLFRIDGGKVKAAGFSADHFVTCLLPRTVPKLSYYSTGLLCMTFAPSFSYLKDGKEIADWTAHHTLSRGCSPAIPVRHRDASPALFYTLIVELSTT